VVDDNDLQRRLAKAVAGFGDLLEPLLDGTLDAHNFQLKFVDRYLHQPTSYDDDVFRIMDRYFSDVEEFEADPALRDGDTLDLDDLLTSTRELLQRAGAR
jgi:hypothetical protein